MSKQKNLPAASLHSAGRMKPVLQSRAEVPAGRLYLHGHVGELLPGLSHQVSQSEDGAERVVASVAAPQVGVVHLREDVPTAKRIQSQRPQSGNAAGGWI